MEVIYKTVEDMLDGSIGEANSLGKQIKKFILTEGEARELKINLKGSKEVQTGSKYCGIEIEVLKEPDHLDF